MQVKATYKNIWSIAYPIMLGSMAQTILNLTDTAFLARVGEVELGASAVAGVFYFVMVMIGMAIGVGTQILISRKAGENNKNGIGKLFDHCVLILAGTSVLLFILMYFFSPVLFQNILKSQPVLEACNVFIHYRSFGIFFILINIAFRSFYTGISQTRIISYSAIIMTSVNILLAYMFIFGHWGFSAMGIAGAAKASALSECIATIYLVVYTLFKKDIKIFRLFRFEKISKLIFKDILQISSPVLMQTILSMGAWFLFFVFIERMGQHELAISNLVRSCYMVLMTPMWGYSSATNSMVSNLIGQNKSCEVIKLVKKIITLSLLTSTILFLINIFDYTMLLQITTSDHQLISDAIPSYHIIWVSMFIFSASIILLSAVSGTGNTRAAMIIEIVNIFIYMGYVYICAVIIKTKLETVWLAEIFYWIIMGVLAYFYLNSRKWIPVTAKNENKIEKEITV